MVTNTTHTSGDAIAADLPQFHHMLNNLKTYLTESITGVTNLHNTITQSTTGREHGISFLEMKCHLFLEYLINITYSMLLKLDGKPISGEACIEHLVEIRTVLSKIKPIEKKLKYQIDKLVKMSSGDGKAAEQNALSFRPNLDNLVGKEEDSEEEEEEAEEEKSGVYVPPKLTAVPYEGDKQSKEERRLEKARKRTLNSNLLADIRDEFGDEPEEISDGRNRGMQKKLKEREDERQRYEEDNLVRLTVTKKDKMMKRKMSMLDEVVKVGKYTGGDEEDSDEEAEFEPKAKKGKKGGKGGKFKKRMQRKRK